MSNGFNESRPAMTREYAKLSLRSGYVAASADEWLKGTRFQDKLREIRWELTEERLAEMKREAIAMGVPADELEPNWTEEEWEIMLTLGKALQEVADGW